MSALVENMFSHREVPWHGLGTIVNNEVTSAGAISLAGLDWRVLQENVYNRYGAVIPNYKFNIRDYDRAVLGLVKDRYTIVQNSEAFEFTDSMLGDGVTYETAGSLSGGNRIWLLAKMPDMFKIAGENYENYLIFTNGHDGLHPVKVSLTPVRVVCNNTLQLALQQSRRVWIVKHSSNISGRSHEAKEFLIGSKKYGVVLAKDLESKAVKHISTMRLYNLIPDVLKKSGITSQKAIKEHTNDIWFIYNFAPDLSILDHSGYRLINAMSDYINHRNPKKWTPTYRENVFCRAIDGDRLLNNTYKAVSELI